MTIGIEQFLFTAGLFSVFLILTIFIRKKYSVIMGFLQLDDETVIKLRSRVIELEKEVAALKIFVNLLMEKLAMQTTVAPQEIIVKKISARPVLLVFGTPTLGELDRNAMRKAGIPFFRLTNGRLEDLKDELQRRRSDGNMYDIVHFSAHGTKDGHLDLNGQLVTGEQLSDVLGGVNCAFLSTCSNHYLADKLVGVVKYVIVVYEEIEQDDAANFVFEFYKRYRVNRDIETSFADAIAISPSVAEFVDLRVGGK